MHGFVRFVLAVSLFVSSYAHAQTVAELVASYRDPKLGESRSASNVSITVGHATYTMPAGTVSTVLAGDKTVGLYLAGAGTFRYETTNKDELSVIRYNAKNNDITVNVGADKATIEDSFMSVLLLGMDCRRSKAHRPRRRRKASKSIASFSRAGHSSSAPRLIFSRIRRSTTRKGRASSPT